MLIQNNLGKELNFNWEKLHKIGSGTYGEVYKGMNKLTQEPIAIKKIKLESIDGIPYETLRECVILRNMEHQNIIKYEYILSKIIKHILYSCMIYLN